jgi:MoxR-like ATPase
VLADEINRASPKTQSAFLEAMQEKQITAGNETYKLDAPFFILATQNPIEMEGTFPLPEAQLDRFLMKILMNYPSFDEERTIVDRYTSVSEPTVNRVIGGGELIALQRLTREVPIGATTYPKRISMRWHVRSCGTGSSCRLRQSGQGSHRTR